MVDAHGMTGIFAFTRAFMVSWTESGPGSQGRTTGKFLQSRPDLGQDGAGRHQGDPRDFIQSVQHGLMSLEQILEPLFDGGDLGFQQSHGPEQGIEQLPVMLPEKSLNRLKKHLFFGFQLTLGAMVDVGPGNPLRARGQQMQDTAPGLADRKSTRLNSSHGYISSALF